MKNLIFSLIEMKYFSVVYTFHRKLFRWQGPVNSGNLVAFSTVMDFLDKNGWKRPSGENETGIMLHLQNLSEPFLSYNPSLTVNSDGGNKNLN
jgi:hypothetical protein